MQIVSIANQKGGSAKTTTAINLACSLARLKKKIMLIDLDPQAQLTYSFGITDPELGNMAEVLRGEKSIQEILIQREGVSIAPSSIDLADVEVELVNKIGRESMLRDRLSEVKGYDLVLIDAPPSLSILTVNALNSASAVLIPAQVEVLSLQGLSQLLGTVHEVKKVLNKRLTVLGVVACMYDSRRGLSSEVLQEMRKTLKVKVFKTIIRENVRIAEAPSFGQSVIRYAPGSHGAEDYMNLAREFIKEGG